MKKLLSIVLILLANLGCAMPRDVEVSTAFKPYYDRFNQWYGTDIHIPISFANLGGQGYAGMCEIWSSGYRDIKIDQVYWNKIDEDSKQQIIFHEGGHCHFNRKHNKGLIDMPDGRLCPKSIMYPYAFGNPCYGLRLLDYLKELPVQEVDDY